MSDFRDELERELVEAARRRAAARRSRVRRRRTFGGSAGVRRPRRRALSGAIAMAAVAAAVALVVVLRPAADDGRRTLAGHGTIVSPHSASRLPEELWQRAMPHAGGSGPPRALADFGPYPVVVIFSASWCQPCQFDIRDVRVHDRARHAADLLRERGVEVLLIAYRDESSSLFANTRLGPGLRFMDPDARLATALGVRAVPAVFALDGFGRVVGRDRGPLDPEFAASLVRRLRLPKISAQERWRRVALEHPNDQMLDRYRPLGGTIRQPNESSVTGAPPIATPSDLGG